jgi:hypothetical protein
MKSIYSIMILALVAFVTTGQTAHAVGVDIGNGTLVPENNPPGVTNETSSNNITGVIRLQNGPLEPNTLEIGAPNSTGVTMLPNGTFAAYLNGGGPGSTIGPVHVINWHNGTVNAEADFHMGKGQMSDLTLGHAPNETSATVTPNENVTGNPHRSQSWNAGYIRAFTGQGLALRTNHTLDFFYGYMNGSEFLHFDQAYAAAFSGIHLNPPHFGDTSGLFEHKFYQGNSSGTRDRHDFKVGENQFTMYSPLPTHTDDNYTNYYIGFDNGAWAADKENQHSTVYYHDNCGTNHINEYCVGFKAGWNYEANALGPPPSAYSSNVTPTASKV